MSRKHYQEAARIVRSASYLSDEAKARLIADLVTFFSDDNARFSRLASVLPVSSRRMER